MNRLRTEVAFRAFSDDPDEPRAFLSITYYGENADPIGNDLAEQHMQQLFPKHTIWREVTAIDTERVEGEKWNP